MPKVLYKRERMVLDFLKKYIQEKGYSPTLNEIAKAVGVTSAATIHEHLNNLADNGFIRKIRVGSRLNIEMASIEKSQISAGFEIPILGYIAAGAPLEPHTDPNASIMISSFLVSQPENSFVLRVKGESMVEDGILDGDYVIVKHQDIAQNGDLVIALLENGLATLKRFFKDDKNNRIRLQPANYKMAPIYTTSVKIQGKVIGVIRKF